MATKHEAKAHLSRDASQPASMTRTKKATPAKGSIGKTVVVKKALPAKKRKRAKRGRPKPAIPVSRLAEPVPDEAAIQNLLFSLDATDKMAVTTILQGLEAHFGSPDAARVWLATRSPEFGTTPLEAIRRGKARLVQAVLEARWGPNPIYA